MTYEEQATSLTHDEIVSLLISQDELKATHAQVTTEFTAQLTSLQQQLDWFKQQLFGSKSERRILEANPSQMMLGELLAETPTIPAPRESVPGYTRRVGKQPGDGPDQSGLRFDASVPVEEIHLGSDLSEVTDVEVIGERITHRLAQKPASYYVKRYIRQVVKIKETGKVDCTPAPPAVLEGTYADVSVLSGLIIDKFQYHLPLYRQHQRMEACGVHVSRTTLTNWVHRTADLLEPVYEALVRSVVASEVLLMDETPIKAGRNKEKHTMRTGYFWPMYGDRDEVVFPFYPTRAHAVVLKELGEAFEGTLMSDGYSAYDAYSEQVASVVHALCWAHTRRGFVKAEGVEPALAAQALSFIRDLYAIEADLRKRGDPDPEKVAAHRGQYSKPIADAFFTWLRDSFEKTILLPKSPFTVAANYALEREKGLRVFLQNPKVPLDTNQVEREIRPIAVGRKNWLFAWTEIGAKNTGILQSLLRTCCLQEVDPFIYLVDVLQRIDTHPAKDVEQLIPRIWKTTFADNPLR